MWLDLTECYSRYISDPAGFQASGEFIRRHGLRILWYGMCVVFVVCVLIVPAVEESQHRQAPPPEKPVMAMERLDLGQNMLFRSCQCLAAFFFFIVGTCVGSFLNVVIYRVPNGGSVLAKACTVTGNEKDRVPVDPILCKTKSTTRRHNHSVCDRADSCLRKSAPQSTAAEMQGLCTVRLLDTAPKFPHRSFGSARQV